MKSNILVTGGYGLIGKSLIEKNYRLKLIAEYINQQKIISLKDTVKKIWKLKFL